MARDYGKSDRPNKPVEAKRGQDREHKAVSGGKYERGPQPNYTKAYAGVANANPNTIPNSTPARRPASPPPGRGTEGQRSSMPAAGQRDAGAPAAGQRDSGAPTGKDDRGNPTQVGADGYWNFNDGLDPAYSPYTQSNSFWGKDQSRVPALPEGQHPYQWNPNKFDEAFSHYTQPGPPNPKPGVPYAGGGFPRPNPGQYPGPPAQKPGIGGPLGPPVRGPYGKAVAYSKVTAPGVPMSIAQAQAPAQFGQPGYASYGSDPEGYGGNGSIGGGFANAGYGTPSYGVNPTTAWNEFNSAQREGFSYGDPGGGGGAAAGGGGGGYGGGNTCTGPGGSEFGTNSNN